MKLVFYIQIFENFQTHLLVPSSRLFILRPYINFYVCLLSHSTDFYEKGSKMCEFHFNNFKLDITLKLKHILLIAKYD
jgi:hypothetical protein